MTKEMILEIARRYTVPEVREEQLFYVDGSPSLEFTSMTYWKFCEEELIAFAQSVIEASQKPLTDEQISQLASGLSDAYGYHLTTETIIRKTQALLLGERV